MINKLRRIKEGQTGRKVADIIYNNDLQLLGGLGEAEAAASRTTIDTTVKTGDGVYEKVRLVQGIGDCQLCMMSQNAVTKGVENIIEDISELDTDMISVTTEDFGNAIKPDIILD